MIFDIKLMGTIVFFKSFRAFPRYLRDHHIFKYVYATCNCSTTIENHFDVFDIFTDILTASYSKNRNIFSVVLSSQNINKRNIKKLSVKSDPLSIKEDEHTKIDQLINEFMIKKQISPEALIHQLECNIQNNNLVIMYQIIQFCFIKDVFIPKNLLLKVAEKFSNNGFIEGLVLLRNLFQKTNLKEYYKQAELLHYSVVCYWIIGNISKCVSSLHDCIKKYPNFRSSTKKIIAAIISESVSDRSEAVMINVMKFVEEYSVKHNDHYPMVVLWHNLFVSKWYSDQNLAEKLLDKHEKLQYCLTFSCPSLTRYLFQKNMINDVYRLLQILLKYKLMKSYSEVLQISFDWFCSREERSRCSEIIKSSVQLNAPLRDEQYNQFIAWTVYGNPYKIIQKAEIEKIYSKFDTNET